MEEQLTKVADFVADHNIERAYNFILFLAVAYFMFTPIDGDVDSMLKWITVAIAALGGGRFAFSYLSDYETIDEENIEK